MHSIRVRNVLWGAVWVALGLLPVACGGGSSGDGPSTSTLPPVSVTAHLTSVGDCADLDAWLVDVGVERFVNLWALGGVGGTPAPMPDPGMPPRDGSGQALPAEDGAAGSVPSDYTTTNVQETGVDELDLVETDGETIYYLRGDTVHVIDAWPPEDAQEIASLTLDGWGSGIFLLGDRLIVLSAIYEGGPDPMEPGMPAPMGPGIGTGEPRPPTTGEWVEPFVAVRVSVFDVTDPSAPSEVRSFDIEGYLVAARLVEGKVYLVCQHSPTLYDPQLMEDLAGLSLPNPWNLGDAARAQAEQVVRTRVRPVIAAYVARAGRERFLPDLRIGDTKTDLLDCADLYRPERAGDLSVLSVVGFDPSDDSRPSGVGVVANGWNVYASPSALYVAQDSRWWMWSEKETRYAETHIHRFDLNDGDPSYRASGKVPGWVLNQFSMSEYEGDLRIATTDQALGGWWWAPVPGGGTVAPPPMDGRVEPLAAAAPPPVDANNVFVLAPDGTDLAMVGALRGIAPGEQIQAVRFLEDTGYVVTFRQTDPLFVVRLDDRTAPEIAGELHMTGFSSYLHPFDADHLIGIGREGTEDGRVLGLSLQLFDVSDPTDPTRAFQTELGTGDGAWSWSEAEHDHHAFTFQPERGLLAIPVTLVDPAWNDADYEHFSGLVVYHVTATDGFEEVGRVSHTGLVRDVVCSPEERGDPARAADCDAWLYPWFAEMRRSIFIEDVLYAFSDVGVTASRLDAIGEPVATIPLP